MGNILHTLRLRANTSERIATIDAAKAAPPPSPLQPVELTNEHQVAGVLLIGARVGEILITAGTANRDVQAQMRSVINAYGLYDVHIDVTLNTIQLSTHIGNEDGDTTPVTVLRVVRRGAMDFSKLARLDRLIRSIRAGATNPATADRQLSELWNSKSPYGVGLELIGWGALAGGFAMVLGSTPIVGLVAFITAMVIMAAFKLIGKVGLGDFFSLMAGGFISVIPAAGAFWLASETGASINPSLIIASGIVVLVAGLTLVQSLEDAIMGAPVTASGRFFEAMLNTGAIIAGVSLGLKLSLALGIMLPAIETQTAPDLQHVAVKIIFGGIAAAGYSLACYSEWTPIWVSGVTTMIGSATFYLVFLPMGLGGIFGAGLTATLIGLIGGLLARRFLIPPLVIAIAGVTPLLPGLRIYRSIYAIIHEQLLVGISSMAIALATAIALAAGIVLGEWMARRIRRPKPFKPYQNIIRRRYSFKRSGR
ncbi:MAG: threonine/serine exporter family protein [Corynebacterium glucuronolyticum]|nr:threonine/serine exporter family protein [Corynebacterium glucuronolyticum]MDD7587236.1 threonine/serine exporter family protein [Mycobacteriaceae bacterium]MDY5834655.1 threonine/serine exporter family protein [Corynebacterium glucuronolyticum]